MLFAYIFKFEFNGGLLNATNLVLDSNNLQISVKLTNFQQKNHDKFWIT